MRMKKLFSLLCAAAIALSAVGGLPAAAEASTEATETTVSEEISIQSETNETLPAPANVREENGFIVWDDVEGATRYDLMFFRASSTNQEEFEYFVSVVTTENYLDNWITKIGTYGDPFYLSEYPLYISICVGVEQDNGEINSGERSDLVELTAKSLTTPTNVYVDENDVIRWDAVDGTAQYLVQIEMNDREEPFYTYVDGRNSLSDWKRSLMRGMEPGDYTIKICICTYNYGFSGELSEPITYTLTVEESLPAPTNVYVDENDVIHWDAVEGATGYRVRLETKEGDYKTLNANTNYLNWKSELSVYNYIYTRNHTLAVSVAAVDASDTVDEYSEPVEFTYSMKSWKANFKYDAETGDLSWDNWTDDVSNGNLNYYLWGIPYRWIVPSTILSDSGYWNPALSGYAPASITLPLEFAYRSLAYPDEDYRGDHTLWLTSCALGSAEEWWTDKIGDYESADTFTYSYDGCDVNPALKPPTDNIWQYSGDWSKYGYGTTTLAYWDSVDGAVGYIVHFTTIAGNQNANGYQSTSSSIINYGWYGGSPDGDWCLEICSVDKNGDRSEWSEPLSFTVKDGKVIDGLAYAYLNNIDSEGNLLLTEAEGAVRYTVSVTGNGADFSFESETPVIEGFSAALKDYPNGEYTLVVSTYNDIGIRRRWFPMYFNKQDEGFFNEGNETGSTVESAPEAAGIPEPDRITSITINPAFNMKNKNDTSVELDLTKIKIKAQEIYDEAGLKRAEEALGEEIIGNKHYNLLDLTLLYNDQDFSNGYDGLVQVIIPLPTGHRDKTFSCYRLIEVDGKMTKEIIPGEQTEDSYIIYLEHFSEYALVADGGETPAPAKQGFYSDGLSILDAEVGTIVTQKTEVKDGKYNIRFVQKVNADTLTGKSKATFTLAANGVTKEVSTTKYYTGLTFDDGTSAKAASGQVFLCYTVTGVPENVSVAASRVVPE